MATQSSITSDPSDQRSVAAIIPSESDYRAWLAQQPAAIAETEHPADTLERWLQTIDPRVTIATRDYPGFACWVNLPDAAGAMWTHITPRWVRAVCQPRQF